MLKLLNNSILGPLLIIVIGLGGLCLLIKYRLYPYRSPRRSLSVLLSGSGVKTACLSLAGTLGVGNITGVASAITVGGAGAVFWMWCFAALSCVIKYSEVVLSHLYKGKNGCGAAYYIEKGLNSRFLGVLFSLLLIISSVGMGNMVQCSSATDGLYYTLGVPKIITCIAFALTTVLLVVGGRNRITLFTSVLIPSLTALYVLISLAIILANITLVPSIIRNIFEGAFSFDSLGGGVVGFLTSKTVRLGAARGILSNEAGCGTTAYAQDKDENNPIANGMWGMVEVVVDTIILCTLTAVVILIAPTSSKEPMEAVVGAYSYFGVIGGDFVGVSAALYGLASVVCWSYYGVSAVKYLGGKKKACILYVVTYSITGILGSVFKSELVWDISDLTVSVMAIFNTLCVIALSGKIKGKTIEYFS